MLNILPSLVISQWVPQQASTSVSKILTTLKEFPGTTPNKDIYI